MAGKIVVDIESNEGKLLQAFQKIQSQEDKSTESLSKMAKQARETERAVARIHESTRTPQEQMRSRIEHLNKLHQQGALDADSYGRAMKQAMFGAARPTEMLAAKTEGIGATLAGLIAKYGGLAAILATVGRAVTDINAKADQAAEGQRTARIPLSKLKQVADTEPEFQSLVGEAKGLYASGGAASLEEAASVVFDVKSAGQMDQLPFLRQLRSTGFVSETGELTKSAIALQTSLGRKETGDLRALVNKAIVASGPSPAGTEAILLAAARAGTEAGALGISDEELLSSISLGATATGSAEESGTRMASLMRSLSEAGAPPKPGQVVDPRLRFNFKGKTLREMVQQIQSRKLNDRELMELLGRHEAVSGYRLIANNLDQVTSLEKDVRAAESNDVVSGRMKWTTPEAEAARKAEVAKAREALSRGESGRVRNVSEAQLLDEERRFREAGLPEPVNWARDIVERGARAGSGLIPGAEGAAFPGGYRPGAMLRGGGSMGAGSDQLQRIADILEDTERNNKRRAAKPDAAQGALKNQGEPAGL